MTYPPQDPNRPVGPPDQTAWDDQTAWAMPPAQPMPPIAPPPMPPASPEGSIEDGEPEASRFDFIRDPLSIMLVLVIVLALTVAGAVGGELYARHRADEVVASAVQCVVQDNVDVSFGSSPFLLQLLNSDFDNISVKTAGNQIRNAKGMTLDLQMNDVKLHKSAQGEGTMGALDAVITWSTDGIKETVGDTVPLLGSLVSNVSTNPSDGTIELEGALGSVTAKPQVVNGGLSLQVMKLSGLGFSLPRETIQPSLDAFTTALTKNLPMGIHADSLQVTDSGVTAKFVTRNAVIPTGQQDPCFSPL